jgi:hypothetical protein
MKLVAHIHLQTQLIQALHTRLIQLFQLSQPIQPTQLLRLQPIHQVITLLVTQPTHQVQALPIQPVIHQPLRPLKCLAQDMNVVLVSLQL